MGKLIRHVLITLTGLIFGVVMVFNGILISMAPPVFISKVIFYFFTPIYYLMYAPAGPAWVPGFFILGIAYAYLIYYLCSGIYKVFLMLMRK